MDEHCYVIKNKTKRGKSIYTVTQGGKKIAVIDASAHKNRDELHAKINELILADAFDATTAAEFSTLALLDLAPGINGVATYTTGEIFHALLEAKPAGRVEWSIGP